MTLPDTATLLRLCARIERYPGDHQQLLFLTLRSLRGDRRDNRPHNEL